MLISVVKSMAAKRISLILHFFHANASLKLTQTAFFGNICAKNAKEAFLMLILNGITGIKGGLASGFQGLLP